MKKTICLFLCVFALFFVACGSGHKTNAIELMGAGDQIHDSYTFANNGVTISHDNNTYLIGGSVDKLTDEAVKQEFEIADSVTHVVAIKLTAVESDVVKDEVEIDVNGVENYDAEHLNGSNYTFIILNAVPGESVSISVKWNKNEDVKTYIVNFDEELTMK